MDKKMRTSWIVSVVYGTAFLVGLAALPRTAEAFPSDVPKHLRAEHKRLPRQVRRSVEVYYQKLRQFRGYLKRADEARAKNALKEAEQWWRSAMNAAGEGAFRQYPVMKKHHAAIVAARRSLKGGLAAALKTGCPRDKYRNRRLKRAIKRALLNTFDRKNCNKRGLPSQRRECKALKEKLRQYSLAGRPTTKYNRYRRRYTERLMVWACVHQKKRGQKAICRAFRLSVQRTKIRGRRWKPWKVYGVAACSASGAGRSSSRVGRGACAKVQGPARRGEQGVGVGGAGACSLGRRPPAGRHRRGRPGPVTASPPPYPVFFIPAAMPTMVWKTTCRTWAASSDS